MQLIDLKNKFLVSLNHLYPPREIISLFEQVMEDYFHYDPISVHQNLHKNIDEEDEKKILSFLHRLKNAEPIQYILGYTRFYDNRISVDHRVLIPRQETEYLVDIIVRETQEKKGLNIIDIGTGSGCIAISLAKHFSGSRVFATDISPDALDLAKANAKMNLVTIEFSLDDILDPKTENPAFDLIVSNPPYVRNLEKQFMHRNILDYEPSRALFVDDDDPLVFFRAIALFADKFLRVNGYLYLEINESLGKDVVQELEKHEFRKLEIRRDLDQKDRFVKAWK